MCLTRVGACQRCSDDGISGKKRMSALPKQHRFHLFHVNVFVMQFYVESRSFLPWTSTRFFKAPFDRIWVCLQYHDYLSITFQNNMQAKHKKDSPHFCHCIRMQQRRAAHPPLPFVSSQRELQRLYNLPVIFIQVLRAVSLPLPSCTKAKKTFLKLNEMFKSQKKQERDFQKFCSTSSANQTKHYKVASAKRNWHFTAALRQRMNVLNTSILEPPRLLLIGKF